MKTEDTKKAFGKEATKAFAQNSISDGNLRTFCSRVFMKSGMVSSLWLGLLIVGSSTATSHAWQKMGYVYCDSNGNGVIDSADLPVPGVLVVVTNVSGTFSNANWTPADGFFIMELPAGPGSYVDYIHPLTLPKGTTAVLPAWHSFTITASVVYATNNFLIQTSPAIAVTKDCPPSPVAPGGTLVYTGTVTNTGTVTLTNVFVVDDQPAPNTPVLGPITLHPGTGTNFSGSYIVTSVTNVSTHTVTTLTTNAVTTLATNAVTTFTTNIVTVTVTNNSGTVTVTNTTITVTTNAAGQFFGTINPVLPAVVNRFIVPPGLNGLTYADQDEGYAATQFYSTRKDDSGTSYFETITAGTAAVVDRFGASSGNFDSLAFAAPDVGYGPVIFYYLRHDNAGVSTFGTITPGGTVGVAAAHFVVGNNFDSLTFSATDVGYGANLFYYVRHDAAGLSTFGTINPALPGTITDRFTVGDNVDALVFTATDVGAGYGADNFYYLRHDNAGVSTFGTISVTGLTTATVTDRFAVGPNATELTFTPTDTGYGPNLFYFLRGGVGPSTNTVTTITTNTVGVITTNTVGVVTTNTVGVVTTNTVPVLTTNAVTTITTNIVAGVETDTVTASGTEICCSRTVTATASCSSSVQPVRPVIVGFGVPPSHLSEGAFGLSFSTQIGVSYTVQCKGSLSDPTWTDLPNMPVVGIGGVLTVTDSTGVQPRRLYRVIVTR